MFTQYLAQRGTTTKRLIVPITLLILLAELSFISSAQQSALELPAPKANEVTQSLTLFRPIDADFDILLSTHFPGFSEASTFQSLRPYLVLVRNDGAVSAIAYTIQWTVKYEDGSVQSLANTYIPRPLQQGSNVTLPPDAVRVVSPRFNLTPKQYDPGVLQYSWAEQFLSSQGAASCRADVEGVLYSDHSYSGPQGAQIWQRYVTTRLAAYDEALNALNLLSSPAGKQKLDSVLNSHMQFGGLDPAPGPDVQIGRDRHFRDTMDMHVYARAESAKDVRDLLLREGDGALEVLKRTVGSRTAYSVFGNHYH